MANRFWVGGSMAAWDGSVGTRWSTVSGGAGGASVPTSVDDVFFDSLSGTNSVSINSGNTGAKSITCTGFGGTLSGSTAITVSGSVTLVAGMGFTYTGTLTLNATGTLTSAGKTLGAITINATGGTVELADALNIGANTLTVTNGTFDTKNYNVTAGSLSSSNSNVRAINLGSSTVTLSGTGGPSMNIITNLAFNAGTSQINITAENSSLGFFFGGLTYYNVTFTGVASKSITLSSTATTTFNNITVTAPSGAGLIQLAPSGNVVINGTLTATGATAVRRIFVRSDTLGTQRDLTVGTLVADDCDFRDITIAGAAAPVSGTRLGDAKGNSGITFGAGVTRYWNLAAGGNWGGAIGWAASSGGSPAINNFPLAQDTCLFEATGLNSSATVTINAAYNIGTIDMSARTSNTMALSCGSTPTIYGNWINGTGLTFTGTGTFTFAGRGSQTLTSAGRTFTQAFTMDNPSGSVTLQDAFVCDRASTTAFNVLQGTIDANSYNFTLSSTTTGVLASNGVLTRAIAIGSGTWTFAAAGNVWNTTGGASLTVTGTGTISLTSTSAKTFTGGSVQTYPILNQGGTGTLTVIGSNKFTDITNSAIGRVQFTGGTTNEFGAFNLNGVLGNLLPLGSTNTTQATLNAPSWNVGIASTDAGNNTGLSFTGLSPNFLSISYINGVITAAPPSGYGNFLVFF